MYIHLPTIWLNNTFVINLIQVYGGSFIRLLSFLSIRPRPRENSEYKTRVTGCWQKKKKRLSKKLKPEGLLFEDERKYGIWEINMKKSYSSEPTEKQNTCNVYFSIMFFKNCTFLTKVLKQVQVVVFRRTCELLTPLQNAGPVWI